MEPGAATIPGDAVELRRGSLSIEVQLRPFSFTVRRAGRRLLRHAGVWAVQGSVNDQFIPLTEGVVAHESLATLEDVVDVLEIEQDDDALSLAVRLRGGRGARLRLSFAAAMRIELELVVEGEPLRLGAEWD